MINKLLLVFLLFFSGLTFAQIGIGKDLPDQSAIVDISATNKGILIPQISLYNLYDEQVIDGNNPKDGLLIYNITEASEEGLVKGFYYWDADKKIEGKNGTWVKLVGAKDNIIEDPITGEIVLKKGDKEQLQGEGFTFDNGRGTSIDFFETLTALSSEIILIDEYDDGETIERKPEEERNYEKAGYIGTRQKVTFYYKDEFGETTDIVLNELVGDSETVTTLALVPDYTGIDEEEESRPVLVFTREDGKKDIIELSDIMQNSETLTTLTVDVENGILIFKDENQTDNPIELGPLFKQPWANANGTSEAPRNGDQIFTNGWVGIGYDKPSDAPNEKLRVRGSITAVNSYYADYVFEKYFLGSTDLKKDYTFLPLEKVESFISENYHLPGVTSIKKIDKLEEGYAFNMSELSMQLLEKTEEAFLYIIEQQKEINELKKMVKRMDTIKNEYENLNTSFISLMKEFKELKEILKLEVQNQ